MPDIFAAEDAVHLPSCDHLNLVGVREVPQILVVAQVGRRVAPLEALKVVRLEVWKIHSQEGPQGVQMVRQ